VFCQQLKSQVVCNSTQKLGRPKCAVSTIANNIDLASYKQYWTN